MRKLLVLLALALPAALPQSPTASRSTRFTAAANGQTIPLIGTGIDNHLISWYPGVGVSTCSVRLESSSNGTSWGNLIEDQSCTAAGAISRAAVFAAYVRVVVSSLAGGSVHIGYFGAQTSTFGPPVCESRVALSQSANTAVIAGQAGRRIHVCSVLIISATDQFISLVEGTGAACATDTTAVLGGVSPSISIISQGGFSAISGIVWFSTAVSGKSLCLFQSGAGNISGIITYSIGS